MDEEEVRDVKNVIVGMGPGGLAAAITLMLAGENVLVLDKREDFNRYQKVHLQYELVTRYWGYTQLGRLGLSLEFEQEYRFYTLEGHFTPTSDEEQLDYDFFCKLERQKSLISIRELQTYLYEKIKLLNQKRSVTITEELALSAGTVQHPFVFDNLGKVEFSQGESTVIDIDPKASMLTLEDNKTSIKSKLRFTNLIDAEGYSRQIVKKVNEQLLWEYFTYQDLPQPRHPVFGTALLKRKTTPTLDKPYGFSLSVETQNLDEEHLPRLQSLGWHHDFLPLYFVGIDHQKGEMYFGGEVPQVFLDKYDKDAFMNWIHLIMAAEYKIPSSEIEVIQEHGTDAMSVFNVNPQCVNLRYMQLTPTTHFFCVGDAVASPNLTFGHGIMDATDDAASLLEIFNYPLFCKIRQSQIEHIKAAYVVLRREYELAKDLLEIGLEHDLQEYPMPDRTQPSWHTIMRKSLERRQSEFAGYQQFFDESIYPLTAMMSPSPPDSPSNKFTPMSSKCLGIKANKERTLTPQYAKTTHRQYAKRKRPQALEVSVSLKRPKRKSRIN